MRITVQVLVVLVLAASACGTTATAPTELREADVATIYADVVVRVCSEARCGVGHPAFVIFSAGTPSARQAVVAAMPEAQFMSSNDGLIGPDGRVIDGGRIVSIEPPRMVRAGIALVDTFWVSSQGEGKGETYVYGWDGNAWIHVDPSTVGITVTTAAP